MGGGIAEVDIKFGEVKGKMIKWEFKATDGLELEASDMIGGTGLSW